MRLAEFLRRGVSALLPVYPEREARNILSLLCAEMLGTESYTHIVEPEFRVDSGKEAALEAALSRLAAGEPIQYVLGKASFCGREFNVGPGVLIPRPETESLCAEALSYLAGRPSVRVLDLCTGSGNIAWTLALSRDDAHVVAVDKSAAALDVARNQPFHAAVPPEFTEADILMPPPASWEPFDLVVSNPPYILESEKAAMRQNVLSYEPASALFVPDADPLVFYRAVAEWTLRLLRPSGALMVEINESLGLSVKGLFEAYGFREVLIVRDFFEKDRFVKCLR